MGRLERLNIPGATYHVMNRGNHKETIFMDPRDCRRFLRIWREQQEVFGVRTLAGCLMGNHFHDVLSTPHGNLSEFMQQVQGQFARWSNWRHGRVGHLFQGRFRDVLIEHDMHLLTALCYVFMNPVAASMCTDLDEYKWSTYAATVGRVPVPSYLTVDWLATLFPAPSLNESQQKLIRLLREPRKIAAYLQDTELNVNPEAVRQVLKSYTGQQIQYASLPRMYRTALRPTLAQVFTATAAPNEQLIYDARVLYGYKNAEIADALGLHPSTISRIFRQQQLARAA